ncbi:MAG: MFS transporter [Saprospiraceae bacterium]|nr:MFS transporter [Saprospiraceae bacterium]
MKDQKRGVVLAGVVGNILEWYDFAIYGFFAPTFGALFFPSENPTVSVIAAFGAFAAGFLMRPIGAFLIGRIGDRVGRKKALSLSIMLMAFPTLMIGLLPTHAQIGVTATLLLVLLRLLQGLSVGGEFTSSIVYLTESAPENHRGLYSSTSLVGAFGGILLGSFIGSVLTGLLTDSQMLIWGWRIPFILGIVVAFVGYLIRRHMPETISKDHKVGNTWKNLWRNKKSILLVSGLNLVSAVSFYAIFIFVVTWLVRYVHEAKSTALQLNTYGLLVLLISAPFFGWVSDRLGRRRVMLVAVAGILLFCYPLVWLMHHPSFTYIFFGQAGWAILLGMYLGPLPATLSELFPPRVRVTSVSVGYNLSYALFGGTTPMVAMWLIQKEEIDFAFVWYIAIAAFVSFFSVFMLDKFKKSPIMS